MEIYIFNPLNKKDFKLKRMKNGKRIQEGPLTEF